MAYTSLAFRERWGNILPTKKQSLSDFVFILVGMSGLEPPTPTLSEKCMFLSGFIRTTLNIPKIKAFWHIKKSFDVNKKCPPDIN